jgi:hypothetical protein
MNSLLVLLVTTLLMALAPAGQAAPAGAESAATAPPVKSAKGWMIEQSIPDYGPVNIFITDQAMRCDLPMGNCIFLAPKYDLYFFNEYTRRITHMDRTAWLTELKSIRQSQLKMLTSKFRLSQWAHSRAEVVEGQPSECYSFQTSEIAANAVTTHYAWVAVNPELKTAAKILNPLLDNLGRMWPPVEGLPLQMVARISTDGKVHTANEWVLKRIQAGPISGSTFELPKGYQSVTDWMQVMSSVDLDEMMGMYSPARKRPNLKPGTGFGY